MNHVLCLRGMAAGLVFLLSAILCAQTWQVFDMDNSPLPSTTVNALAEDPEGGIWIGTDWGLCHLDGGGNWEVFQVGNSGIPSNDVRSLAVDALGRLWIGTLSEGVVVWDGEDWTVYTNSNSPLPENGIRDLFIDHRDWIWITTSGGLACFTGTSWNIYDDTASSFGGLVCNTNNMRTVAVRPDGLVCLGTFNGGLHYLTETNVLFLTSFNDGFFDNTANDVLFDPVSGDRWVGTPSAGLLRQQGPAFGGSWFQWNGSIGFPSNSVNCIDMDANRSVWSGSQIFGLVSVDQLGQFTQYTTTNSGLPDNEVVSVLSAADGSIWAGTVYGGLARYRAATGLAEIQRPSVSVYPNPCVDRVQVQVGGGAVNWEWSLCDTQGKLVQQGNGVGPMFGIDLLPTANGIHALRLMNKDFVETIVLLIGK